MVFWDRWPLKSASIHTKFLMQIWLYVYSCLILICNKCSNSITLSYSSRVGNLNSKENISVGSSYYSFLSFFFMRGLLIYFLWGEGGISFILNELKIVYTWYMFYSLKLSKYNKNIFQYFLSIHCLDLTNN